MNDVRWFVLLVAFVAGCASSSSSTRRTRRGQAPEKVEPTPPPPPRCQVRERTLAPTSSHPRAAIVAPFGDALAIAWTEHVGEHDTLRLLVVDAHGVPKSPSVEVTDRVAAISDPVVRAEGDGLVVGWSEPNGHFMRALDAHARPHSDVQPSTLAPSIAAPSPSCVREGNVCKYSSPDGAFALPADEQPLSASSAGMVVSVSASGLRLWLNECR